METGRISQSNEPTDATAQCRTRRLQRILVVEDDFAICQANVSVLTRFGYEVDATEDGAAAWKALNAQSYDLLITDNNMPRVSGLELVKMVRFARMALPVIMASGTIPEELTQGPWLQPGATLLKPFTGDELLGTVKKVLRG